MVTPSKRTLDESSWGKCQRSPLRKQHDEREEQRRLPEPSECHEEGEQNGKHEEQATQEEGQERKRKHRDKPKKDHKVKGEGREEERKGGGQLASTTNWAPTLGRSMVPVSSMRAAKGETIATEEDISNSKNRKKQKQK
ncbi:hypothetical protein N7533_003473 [Penicillium manginii]|uniref:uncharacterized protein n=1 Tax=Penicillium manginii TaxID=203109 RepID=UPI002546D58B|nr:uncharacterized protein N7533_003473 [Penicillium manginii]KAJ5761434.1 hypothetical protein N7533_003473 [Penicillium manginii]